MLHGNLLWRPKIKQYSQKQNHDAKHFENPHILKICYIGKQKQQLPRPDILCLSYGCS